MNPIIFGQFISYLTSLFHNETSNHHLMEGQVSHIAEYVQRLAPPANTDYRSVDTLLRSLATNRKIEAIKEYRSLTGRSLKESKNAVDHFYTMQDNYGTNDDDSTIWQPGNLRGGV